MTKVIGLAVSLAVAIASWNMHYVRYIHHGHRVVVEHHKPSTIKNVTVLGTEVIRVETWFNTVYDNPQRPEGKLPAYLPEVQEMISDACFIAANIHASLPTFEGQFQENYCA